MNSARVLVARTFLAFFFCLTLANTASAAPFTPRMLLAYDMANRYWSAPPSGCSATDFEIVPDGSLPFEREAEATIPQPGGATPCILYVERHLANPNFFPRMCAIIFHEDGHLHGLGHSPNPRSIMYPEVTFVPNACWRADLWLMNHPRRYR